jgi:hypothetical protein
MPSEQFEKIEAIRALTRNFEQDAIRQRYEKTRVALVEFLDQLRGVREGYRLLRELGQLDRTDEPADLATFIARPVSLRPEIHALLADARRGDERAISCLRSTLCGAPPVWGTLIEVASEFEFALVATVAEDFKVFAALGACLGELDERLPRVASYPELTLAIREYMLADLHLELVRRFANRNRRSVLRDYWEQRREEAQQDFNRAAQAVASYDRGGECWHRRSSAFSDVDKVVREFRRGIR